MPFRPCVSGCGRYLAPGDGHDRCLSCLGIEHAEVAFVDESCSHCGGMTVRSSATCKGAGYLCLCRDLGFPLVAARGVLLRAVAGLVSRWQWGIPLQKDWGLLALAILRADGAAKGTGRPLPWRGGTRLYPLVLPPTIGCRSLHRRVSQTNLEMMVQYRCHSSGQSAVPDSDP